MAHHRSTDSGSSRGRRLAAIENGDSEGQGLRGEPRRSCQFCLNRETAVILPKILSQSISEFRTLASDLCPADL